MILVVSLAFALIGVTTNYWYQSLSNEFNEGLWVICRPETSIIHSSLSNNEICLKQPYFKSQSLAISGFVFLTIALILSIIQRYRKTDRLLSYLTIVILLATTLLLMFSYLLFPREINFRQLGYSLYFMVFSSLLSLITTGLIAFNAKSIQTS